MIWLYNLVTLVYGLIIKIASMTNPKAAKWISGRNNQNDIIQQIASDPTKKIWMHVASLGEYEQGLPVLVKMRRKYPTYKTVVSFYSPSGFENAKNSELIDFKIYLPLDRKKSMEVLITAVNPLLVVLVKYDFWYHFMSQLRVKEVPVILICAAFRKTQWIFKFYGQFIRNELKNFKHIFNQSESSFDLLSKKGFLNISIGGDTRVDRVIQNSKMPFETEPISKFFTGRVEMVCGSTWPADIKILAPFINDKGIRVIIAPHEIHESNLKQIESLIAGTCVRYSKLKLLIQQDVQVLIVDKIGVLSKLYRLGQMAYVGGGFTNGIHNILEAAVYQIPLLFGPKYSKFIEARELIRLDLAKSISDKESLEKSYIELDKNRDLIKVELSKYFEKSQGATQKVLNYIDEHNLAS